MPPKKKKSKPNESVSFPLKSSLPNRYKNTRTHTSCEQNLPPCPTHCLAASKPNQKHQMCIFPLKPSLSNRHKTTRTHTHIAVSAAMPLCLARAGNREFVCGYFLCELCFQQPICSTKNDLRGARGRRFCRKTFMEHCKTAYSDLCSHTTTLRSQRMATKPVLIGSWAAIAFGYTVQC